MAYVLTCLANFFSNFLLIGYRIECSSFTSSKTNGNKEFTDWLFAKQAEETPYKIHTLMP